MRSYGELQYAHNYTEQLSSLCLAEVMGMSDFFQEFVKN
jgi:hypothetical protein